MYCFFKVSIKAPNKNASGKICLLESSAAYNYLSLLTNLSIEANRVDLVCSGSALFFIEAF